MHLIKMVIIITIIYIIGNTSVHLATISGNLDILRILEKNSANFESCDNATGNNPLHYACQS